MDEEVVQKQEKTNKSEALKQKIGELANKIESEPSGFKRKLYKIKAQMLVSKLDRQIERENIKQTYEERKAEREERTEIEQSSDRTEIIKLNGVSRLLEKRIKELEEFDYTSSKFILPKEDVTRSGGISNYIEKLRDSKDINQIEIANKIEEVNNLKEKLRENKRISEVKKEKLIGNYDKLEKENKNASIDEIKDNMKINAEDIFGTVKDPINTAGGIIKDTIANTIENKNSKKELEQENQKEMQELEERYQKEMQELKEKYKRYEDRQNEIMEARRTKIQENTNNKNNQQTKDTVNNLRNIAGMNLNENIEQVNNNDKGTEGIDSEVEDAIEGNNENDKSTNNQEPYQNSTKKDKFNITDERDGSEPSNKTYVSPYVLYEDDYNEDEPEEVEPEEDGYYYDSDDKIIKKQGINNPYGREAVAPIKLPQNITGNEEPTRQSNNDMNKTIDDEDELKFFIKVGKDITIEIDQDEFYKMSSQKLVDGMNLKDEEIKEKLGDYVDYNDDEMMDKINNEAFDKGLINAIYECEEIDEDDRRQIIQQYMDNLHGKKELENSKGKNIKPKEMIEYDMKAISKTSFIKEIFNNGLKQYEKFHLSKIAMFAEKQGIANIVGKYKPNWKDKIIAKITGKNVKCIPDGYQPFNGVTDKECQDILKSPIVDTCEVTYNQNPNNTEKSSQEPTEQDHNDIE